jgi:SAM-dependent methyltransferase
MPDSAHDLQAPSEWVGRFAPLIVAAGRVADVACGHGRHARFLQQCGFSVTAIDRDAAALETLRGLDRVEPVLADIESGPWPYAPGTFDGVVVTNYLWRPLLPHLVAALRAGGVLIYETFALGNEDYGRPANPDFLLRRNELLEWAMPPLEVVAFEQGLVARPKPAVIQRICAVRDARGRVPLGHRGPAGTRSL